MQIQALSGSEVALRILSQAGTRQVRGQQAPAGAAAGLGLDVSAASGRATSSTMAAIQSLGTFGTPSASARALQIVQALAKDGALQNAARGDVDDTLRNLVKDGKIPVLEPIDGADYVKLKPAEENVYGILRALQDLYGAMPKSLDQALHEHVAGVLKDNQGAIDRIKTGIADGSLKGANGWNDIVTRLTDELTAAREGRIRIQAVNDPRLMKGDMQFTAVRAGLGWSGSSVGVEVDEAGLLAMTGDKYIIPGASPYTANYVISW